MTTKKTMAVLVLAILVGCSSSTTFDPNEGSDVFSVNAPTDHDSESKMDSSTPPDSAYNPPPDTNDSSPDTTDTSDSESTEATDTDSADGDSGMIVVPPSPDTFVGIDAPVVNSETSPDTTDTVDNIETAESDDSDDSSDTPASTDSADGEEMEIATVSCVCLDDNNQCTKDFCNEMDECVHQLIKGCCKEDAECDDGDKCNSFEKCCHEFGFCFICTFIEPPLCDDDNPCTDNSCDPSTGGCVFTPNNSSCDDNNPCTINDACQNKECVGEPVQCECQSTADCAKLEDGNPCNGTLKCQNMVCVVDTETVINCLDDDLCTDDSCNQDTGKCTHTNTVCESDSPYVGAWCNPSVGCVYDQLDCVWDTECGDDDACTDDTCVYGQCVNTNTCECTQDSQCDDGSKCTIDSCVGGKCQNEKVVCVDPDVCTKGVCIETGCIYVPITDCCVNDVECDDGDVCNGAETCDMNKCVAGQKLVCSDFNVCTDDFCDSADGCVYEYNSNPCNDGDACTGGDVCVQGECAGKVVNCDDSGLCTTDSCNPATGCINEQIVGCCMSQIDCKDNNICTNDICMDNWCDHQPIPSCCVKKSDCDDNNVCTADSCANNVCKYTLTSPPACCNLNTECSDNNVCNGAEVCAGNKCVPGIAPNCNDSNVCTADSCDPATGCANKKLTECCNLDAECDDEDICNGAEVCTDHKCLNLYDVVNDKDFDCIKDQVDNCQVIANADQADVDLDGVGDKCDLQKNCNYTKNYGLPAEFWNWPTTGGCVAGCLKKDGAIACLYRHNMDGNCTIDFDGDGAATDLGDCKEKQFDLNPFWCWGVEGPPPSCLTDGWTAATP